MRNKLQAFNRNKGVIKSGRSDVNMQGECFKIDRH